MTARRTAAAALAIILTAGIGHAAPHDHRHDHPHFHPTTTLITPKE